MHEYAIYSTAIHCMKKLKENRKFDVFSIKKGNATYEISLMSVLNWLGAMFLLLSKVTLCLINGWSHTWMFLEISDISLNCIGWSNCIGFWICWAICGFATDLDGADDRRGNDMCLMKCLRGEWSLLCLDLSLWLVIHVRVQRKQGKCHVLLFKKY